MIKTVLFDLDGTLLPMNNDDFVKYYFGLLCKKLAPKGYESKSLVDAIWGGTAAMVKNDGSVNNEKAFWKRFAEILGEHVLADEPEFESFYANEFDGAKVICGYNQKLVDFVHFIKDKGIKVGLATNPIFPYIATEKRTRWAGFEPDEFEIVTTYENIGVSKPNPEYYRELLKRLDVKAEETLMVGNDVNEDIIASAKAGIKGFLLTDHIINRDNVDLSDIPHGDADALKEYFLSVAE